MGFRGGGVKLTPSQRILVFNYPSRDRVKALACDGTVTITGRISRAMFLVEKEIQRNEHWLVCLLHMNELHLRNVLLFIKLKR